MGPEGADPGPPPPPRANSATWCAPSSGGPAAEDREREILEFLVGSYTKNHVAERLGLSPHTIDAHVRSIHVKLHLDNMKLHVNNGSGAVAKALKEHLL